MPTHISGGLKNDEAHEAAWEGGRGAAIGALKWGSVAAMLGVAGYTMSPIYRGLTLQFKVFIQMAGMIVGASVEADHRVREYEAKMRVRKRLLIDRAAWERYEEEFPVGEHEEKGK